MKCLQWQVKSGLENDIVTLEERCRQLESQLVKTYTGLKVRSIKLKSSFPFFFRAGIPAACLLFMHPSLLDQSIDSVSNRV